jgi:hypothetical protein
MAAVHNKTQHSIRNELVNGALVHKSEAPATLSGLHKQMRTNKTLGVCTTSLGE